MKVKYKVVEGSFAQIGNRNVLSSKTRQVDFSSTCNNVKGIIDLSSCIPEHQLVINHRLKKDLLNEIILSMSLPAPDDITSYGLAAYIYKNRHQLANVYQNSLFNVYEVLRTFESVRDENYICISNPKYLIKSDFENLPLDWYGKNIEVNRLVSVMNDIAMSKSMAVNAISRLCKGKKTITPYDVFMSLDELSSYRTLSVSSEFKEAFYKSRLNVQFS